MGGSQSRGPFLRNPYFSFFSRLSSTRHTEGLVACPPNVVLIRVALSASDLLTAALDDGQPRPLTRWTDGSTCQGQTAALCEGTSQVLVPTAPGLVFMQRVDVNNTPIAAARYRLADACRRLCRMSHGCCIEFKLSGASYTQCLLLGSFHWLLVSNPVVERAQPTQCGPPCALPSRHCPCADRGLSAGLWCTCRGRRRPRGRCRWLPRAVPAAGPHHRSAGAGTPLVSPPLPSLHVVVFVTGWWVLSVTSPCVPPSVHPPGDCHWCSCCTAPCLSAAAPPVPVSVCGTPRFQAIECLRRACVC